MLREATKRLEATYSALRAQRAGLGYPVFAIEHGLSTSEVEALQSSLADEFRRSRRFDDHLSACWVAAATEIGYGFDGEEFWRSFEVAFPRWNEFKGRPKLRSWFESFARRFSGVTPKGRFADRFNIIAWPLTHAILPQDLQSQFAELLYACRYELARNGHLGAEQAGKILRQANGDDETRFGRLLQQCELIGRLVLALRDEDVVSTVSPIERGTLKRIVADVEKKRSARDWLDEARRILRDARTRVSTQLVAGNVVRPESEETTSAARSERRTWLAAARSGSGEWRIGLGFPDFADLLTPAPVQSWLNGNRYRLAGQGQTWQPARGIGSLSAKEKIVGRLPASSSLLELEKPSATLTELLSRALSVPGGSPWLLRVHADGVARQVFGNNVRPGQDYLIASFAPLDASALGGLGLQIERDDEACHLYRYKPPSPLPSGHLPCLKQLGFGHLLGAKIEPLGLVPRFDPVATVPTWFPDEDILLRLTSDFPTKQFSVRLDGANLHHVVPAGGTTLLTLGRIAIGRHELSVTAVPSTVVDRKIQSEPETFGFVVRAPRPGPNARSAGMSALLEPPHASFEDFAAGDAGLVLLGPRRQVTAAVEFFDINGHAARNLELGKCRSGESRCQLPRLGAAFRDDDVWEVAQASPRIDLVFRAEELGETRWTFRREVTPIRWRYEFRSGKQTVRLIDEADAGEEVVATRYDLRSPANAIRLSADECLAGVDLTGPGALFVARLGSGAPVRTLVTRRLKGSSSLADLRVDHHFDADTRNPRRLTKLINLLRMWGKASTSGPLAPTYRFQTCRAIESLIASVLCGPEWPEVLSFPDRAQRLVGAPGFVASLKSQAGGANHGAAPSMRGFMEAASRYGVCDEAAISRLAWSLAFDPDRIRFESAAEGQKHFVAVASNRTLIRAAYFARSLSRIASTVSVRDAAA